MLSCEDGAKTISVASFISAHLIKFRIEPYLNNNKLCYQVAGTYGGRVQDMSFKPILKGVMKEELLRIKNAIESSEIIPQAIVSKTVKPI